MIETLGLFEKLQEWSEDLKEFMLSNDKSPLIYGSLFLIGIVIFAVVYNALHKD